jgi:hypothetical protein
VTKPPLQLHPIRVEGGQSVVDEVRWELFVFHDVRDVLPTDAPDVLMVIFRGEPQPATWLETLRAAGYRVAADRSA